MYEAFKDDLMQISQRLEVRTAGQIGFSGSTTCDIQRAPLRAWGRWCMLMHHGVFVRQVTLQLKLADLRIRCIKCPSYFRYSRCAAAHCPPSSDCHPLSSLGQAPAN